MSNRIVTTQLRPAATDNGNMTDTTRWIPLVCCLLGACLGEPPPSPTASNLYAIGVTSFDPNGHSTPLDAIVRRPALEALTSVPLNANAPPVFLFDGSPDPELIEDLAGPPLRIATESRLLAASIAVDQQAVHVTPIAPLQPGQAITLAIGAWAVGEDGTRWTGEAPFTQLLRVTTAATGGATPIASWPANGASGVAPNLAFAALAFDGAIDFFPASMDITSADGTDIVTASSERVACEDVGLAAHDCVRWAPDRTLRPATTYTLAITEGWTDATGSPLDIWQTRFTTAEATDPIAPQATALPCTLDELTLPFGCALVSDTEIQLRLATDEASLLSWQLNECARSTIAAFRGEARFAITNLPSEQEQLVRLRFTDAAGNSRSFEERITTRAPLPAVTVSEIRSDPVGPEPQQEYVELANFGENAIDLFGYSLSDDAFDEGDVIERSVWLHPGGRVLLVADDFDSNDPRDQAPAPGAMLIRLGSSLAGGGLSNSGEALFLRDSSGARVSQTPSVASAGAGVCLQRRDLRSRDGSIHGFVHDADHACTPGL